MTEIKQFCIDVSEAKDIPELVDKHLLAVLCLCHHGIGRSWVMSEYLNAKGIPSMFIEGGLQVIGKSDYCERRKIIQYIGYVPEILVLLDPYEINFFSSILGQIESERENLVRYADFETSTDDVLSYFQSYRS